jgi:hypothetical protein
MFVDKNGDEREMSHDGRGPWFYSTSLTTYAFHDPEAATSTSRELVKVVSRRTSGDPATALVATHPIEIVYTPTAQPPIVRRVTYHTEQQRLYARIEPGGALPEDEVDWVRLFHPDLTEGTVGGYRSLQRTIFSFEDPYGWDASALTYLPGMRLVAHTRGGRYTALNVDDISDLGAYRSGTFWMATNSRDNWIWSPQEFWTPEIDLDAPEYYGCTLASPFRQYWDGQIGAYLWEKDPQWSAQCVENDPRQATHYARDSGFLNDPARTLWNWWLTTLFRVGRPDLYVRVTGVNALTTVVGFHRAGTAITELGGVSSAQYYDALGYHGVLAHMSQFSRGFQGGGTQEATRPLANGSILAFETDEGRLGKARVQNTELRDSRTYYRWSMTKFKYTVYDRPADVTPPSGMTYATPDAYYAVGKTIAANRPVLTAGDFPMQFRVCAVGGTPCSTEAPGLLPSGLVFDGSSGWLSGTPTASFPRTRLEVFATNTGGETSTPIYLTVQAPPGDPLYLPSTVSCSTGYGCTVDAPGVTGDVDSFAISPPLPTGLVFDKLSGAISGTPTVVTSAGTYTVTARNSAGSSATTTLTLSTPLSAPSDLLYTGDPYYLTSGTPVPVGTSYVPTVKGGIPPSGAPADRTQWSVSPPLPAGLQIDLDTGALYGTPSIAADLAEYVVSAANTAGSATVPIHVQVAP